MQQISWDHANLDIRGALDLEQTADGLSPRRLPAWTRPQVPAFMDLVASQPSGVRLEFATDSRTIDLKVCLTRVQMGDRPPRRASFDWIVDGRKIDTQTSETGHLLSLDLMRPGQSNVAPGEATTLRQTDLPEGMKQIQIWLPHAAKVALQSLHIDDDARLLPYTARPNVRWIHHGSSISHCAEAQSPTGIWPQVAAQLANVDLLNLGFGGNCQLDQFVARTIRDIPADAVSLKLGINVVNMDSMRERTFAPAVHGFLDTLREGKPDTPILIVSPIYCPSAETHPGPTLPNKAGKFVTFPGSEQIRAGCLTLTWIRKILSRLVATRQQNGDNNLHYLDGLQLFGADDAQDLPDDLHPNSAGYARMGQRFHQLAFSAGGAFGSLTGQPAEQVK